MKLASDKMPVITILGSRQSGKTTLTKMARHTYSTCVGLIQRITHQQTSFIDLKVMTKRTVLLTSLLAVQTLCLPIEAQLLFSDHFDSDTSSKWIIIDESINDIPDASVTFAHDYTTDEFTITRGGTVDRMSVPKNPFDTGDSTLGLKISVNSDAEAGEASVSLFPGDLSIEGDHALRFEMFMSYNGPAYGGSGSTELATMGVGHSGEWVAYLDGNLAVDGDGTFFAVSGEGGASRDFRAYAGDGFGEPEFLDEQTGRHGFTDMDGDGIGEYNTFAGGPLERVFPLPPHETKGAPGKGWVAIEVRREGDAVTWIMNGHIIATISEDKALFGGKNVMIGYTDPFASIANPSEENFVIFDNLRVVQLADDAIPPVVNLSVPGEIVRDETLERDVFKPTPVHEGDAAAVFKLTRSGSTADPLTVSYQLVGSATVGVDFRASTSLEATFPAGANETEIVLTIIDDAEEELDEVIEVMLNASDRYNTSTGKFAFVPLLDNGDKGIPEPDALANAIVTFKDDFNSDSSSDWTINRSSDDTTVSFAYDYSVDGIPTAPGSEDNSSLGLKFTANEIEVAAAHITMSPNGQSFAGDYALVFDLWMNVNGPLPGGGGGSTEFAAAGIGTSGDHVQVGDDQSDGAWFIVTGEGGSSRDFRFFLNNVFLTEDSGVYPAGTQDSANDYYGSIFPAGKTAPESQIAEFANQAGETSAGQVAFEWVRVQLLKIGDQVTWSMNGTDIAVATQDTAPFNDSGNIFLGYSDWFSSVSDNEFMSFGLFDNVKVYQLPVVDLIDLSISIERSNENFTIHYTGTLEQSTHIDGPWTVVPNDESPYEQVIDSSADQVFYRVVR